MLEKVDLNKSVDKENYKKLREEMDVKLGELQRACKEEKIPVVIVFDGFGAGGKGTQINRLIQPLDPRGFDVYASRETGEEERMRPFLWRYWTKTPEDGRMMIFDKSWYDKVTVDRFDKETKRQELNGAFRDILSFEKQLADSGMILIKLFLYISRDEQKKRFKRLEESKETAWRVTEADWKRNKDYDTFLEMNEEMLQRTDTGYAPWTIVEATDKNYAAVKILSTVTDRLEYELNTIQKMGYTDYYLIVVDFVQYAKDQGIPVGPGRGSGAGSIAAYCIGITDIDPMKYDLLFERFLNPERVSMPDFDIDFCYERRQEVIDYVTRKYGADHVAQIVTFGTLAARAAIRDVGRVMGMPYAAVDAVAKLVPRDLHISLDQAIKKSAPLRKLMAEDPKVQELMDTARQIEGMPRNASTHAAGVVITRDPVASYVPLATNDDVVVTQYIMTTLEELGLLKMDFLGLRTLTVIHDAARAANIDINTIDINDPAVYKLFAAGKTEGIFQFESAGMKEMLQKLRPTCLEHLIAATSLYRPGPADQIDGYVACANDPSKVRYKTPLLKPILENTYGFIVYQEQVMQIFRALAGYSYGQADVVRRAMSKKKHDVMERERTHFVTGAVANGVEEAAANAIFDDMAGFASYAFNKSHAACYALVAYRTAYLKVHAPAQFMAALLTSVLDRSNKVASYIAECKRMGLQLAPPDVNTSMKGFTAEGKVIHYGLLGIKNSGSEFINDIIAERENGAFESIFDFCRRLCDKHFNRRAVESLIRCGALDHLGANRRQMLQALPAIVSNLDEYKNSLRYGQVGFFELSGGQDFGFEFDLPQVEEFPKNECLKMEKEMTGLFLSGHPMDKYDRVLDHLGYPRTAQLLAPDGPYKDGQTVTLCGSVTGITMKKTRTGESMAFVQLSDPLGSMELLVFPKVLTRYARFIAEGKVITVTGALSLEEEKDAKILANTIDGPPTAQTLPLTEHAAVLPAEEKRHKHRGLFLRLDSQTDPRLHKAQVVTSIFDGPEPLWYYYKDTGRYVRAPQQDFVSVNPTMLAELKRILGHDNVVYIAQ